MHQARLALKADDEAEGCQDKSAWTGLVLTSPLSGYLGLAFASHFFFAALPSQVQLLFDRRRPNPTGQTEAWAKYCLDRRRRRERRARQRRREHLETAAAASQ